MPLENDFKDYFEALTGFGPLSWQKRLFGEYFARGEIPASVDIPTGLGKTAVMALWLIARARHKGKALPRRLVYVVDRRAVVDQATDFALELRERLDGEGDVASSLKADLDLAGCSLPISTLRGQHVDNREWQEDPGTPAIVVGTVDMIGSRLLFEGYGVSRKMRPYHAGLLGVDTLVVLDESHLVPPFERLIEAIARDSGELGPRGQSDDKLIPPFRLLSLSATGRERSDHEEPHLKRPVTATGRGDTDRVFRLEDSDLEEPHLEHSVTKQRLDAKKGLEFHPIQDEKSLPIKLAEAAWNLCANRQLPVRCILFCNSRDTAEKTQAEIEKLKKKDQTDGDVAPPKLFVGARRVFEREKARERLQKMGFIAKDDKRDDEEPKKKYFLIATSAGEVGVDLDADHMVCDLVAWERMVQRLGRVNRRGEGDARVLVIDPGPPKPKKVGKPTPGEEKTAQQHTTVHRLLDRLPKRKDDGLIDVSPGALRSLKRRAEHDLELQALIDDATTPEPLRPALTRPLVDAWSMTSLKEHTGRPEVGPWLRGWVDDDPQTAVVWRRYLPVRTKGIAVKDQEIEAFFEAAPPHTSERLETETYRVVDWLLARAKAIPEHKNDQPNEESTSAADDTPPSSTNEAETEQSLRGTDTVAYAFSPANDLRQRWTLEELRATDTKARQSLKEYLLRRLPGTTLVVDWRMGGLDDEGMVDHKQKDRPRTVDDGKNWLETEEDSSKAGSASATPCWRRAIPSPPAENSNTAKKVPTPPVIRFRVHSVPSDSPDHKKTGTPTDDRDAHTRGASDDHNQDKKSDTPWRERFRFVAEQTDEGEVTRWLIVDKWQSDAANENDRSITRVGREQILKEHQEWAACRARELAERLDLPEPYSRVLEIAARLHDRGKAAERWQRAFNAPRGNGPYAKTRGPVNVHLLAGYRHEFGSLPQVEKDPDFQSIPEDIQELVQHLIAAHHGQARPVISTGGCEDAPPSRLESRAREVALRFVRLQKRWGPWGLAWWESLLRAADQQASRDNDEKKSSANSKETD
ncbi:MAG: type I-U CRISPR-associated helicase/endonuclease Cas3 [Candidatus Thiosymbion ectosymbiont of Robbea hypermnestra]|nr:type I-U CRISPR-associated helicase/endonuclease Cas3 [Candidatus Thiosymbion ectosymbiont of Robbea hypermnestra]